MRTSIFAAILLIVLSLTDAVLTSININHWGMDCEWNQLMRYLIETYGLWTMFAVKSIAGLFLLLILYNVAESRLAKWVTPVLFALIGAYSVIVFYGYILATA